MARSSLLLAPADRPVSHRIRHRGALLITCLTALTMVTASLTPPAAAATRPGSASLATAELQKLLDQIVAGGAPGAIGLVRQGDMTVRAASGTADLGSQRAMSVRDRFRVGSITKSFVATVVLQLAGERRLGLDDPVELWLPGLVPNGRHITVRQLLNHTSGLFNYTDDPRVLAPYLQQHNPHFVWRPRQLVAIATSHPPLFPPGTAWAYSNTGYILLGLIVERVTGTDLGRQLSRRIFDPLRLRNTSFPVTSARIPGRHAHGYANFTPGAPLTDTTELGTSWAWAAGSIVSTVDDVARFYRALLGGRLLRPDLLAVMKTTVAAGNAGFRYGLGLINADAPCAPIWGHNGDYVGYFDFAIISDAADRQVVLMMNLDDETNTPPAADEAFTTALLTSYCPSVLTSRKEPGS